MSLVSAQTDDFFGDGWWWDHDQRLLGTFCCKVKTVHLVLFLSGDTLLLGAGRGVFVCFPLEGSCTSGLEVSISLLQAGLLDPLRLPLGLLFPLQGEGLLALLLFLGQAGLLTALGGQSALLGLAL